MTPETNVRQLLEHAEWLRRLAGRLVRDGGDDLAQETWLAAVRSPPDRDRPARPWLAEVLRNFARRSHRDRQSRQRREQASAADATAAAPDPEQLLAAAQLQRTVAELVLALDEPYRTTILLRFYQGVEPAEIGRQAGVPAGTVRWRVNEAIRRLRQGLDADKARPDWRRALLLAGPAGPGAAALRGGMWIMGTKAKLGIVSAGVLVVALAGVGIVAGSRNDDRASVGGVTSPAGGISMSPRSSEGTARPSPGSARPGGQPAAGRHADIAPAAGAGPRPPLPPPRFAAAPGGRAAPGTTAPTAEGELDPDELRRAMRQVLPHLKACYVRLLERDPRAGGRIVVKFTLIDAGDGTGKISEASVEPAASDNHALAANDAPELIDPLTEQCVVNAVGAAAFPAPQGGPVEVTYPFSFTPSGGDTIPSKPR